MFCTYCFYISWNFSARKVVMCLLLFHLLFSTKNIQAWKCFQNSNITGTSKLLKLALLKLDRMFYTNQGVNKRHQKSQKFDFIVCSLLSDLEFNAQFLITSHFFYYINLESARFVKLPTGHYLKIVGSCWQKIFAKNHTNSLATIMVVDDHMKHYVIERLFTGFLCSKML